MAAEKQGLRRGWTTGACAAAAAKAACAALVTGEFPDPVQIRLPGGQEPFFALARQQIEEDRATAGIIKDAGDDPDVTHGALILSTLRPLPAGSGIRFRAGPGVGTVTRAGLPIAPGEPAINPVPRRMIVQAIADIAGNDGDFEVTVSVPGGEKIAERTLNGRLGIVGGISILGTTGIVVPYSCAAWIASIHRGVDVARAAGYEHVAASTGSTSEQAVRKLYRMDEAQLLDMGDFVGGTLKYLRKHPISRVTIAGGIAKMTKLAQGSLDLHSARGRADLGALATLAGEAGASQRARAAIESANTVLEAFEIASKEGIELGDIVACLAWRAAAPVLENPAIELEVILFDRTGRKIGHAPFAPAVHPSLPRKRR